MDRIPLLHAAVIIERRRDPNPWEPWGFRIAEVVRDEGHFGTGRRQLRDDGTVARFLFPGLPVSLHRDEAEGYHLNLTSGTPVWFVMWRLGDTDASDAWPEIVTLSYHQAARLLDAQERVDNVPLPPDITAWLQSYADEHYRPEPRRRQRPASFREPERR